PAMFRIAFSCSLAACIVAGCIATPRDTQGGALVSGPEASIPFANQRSTIREWQADGVHGIWVQDVHRNWYYGKFHASCFGLDFANVVGFRTGSTGRLDRFSSIEVPDEQFRCRAGAARQRQTTPGRGWRGAVAGCSAGEHGLALPQRFHQDSSLPR